MAGERMPAGFTGSDVGGSDAGGSVPGGSGEVDGTLGAVVVVAAGTVVDVAVSGSVTTGAAVVGGVADVGGAVERGAVEPGAVERGAVERGVVDDGAVVAVPAVDGADVTAGATVVVVVEQSSGDWPSRPPASWSPADSAVVAGISAAATTSRVARRGRERLRSTHHTVQIRHLMPPAQRIADAAPQRLRQPSPVAPPAVPPTVPDVPASTPARQDI